ncbi:hypothetical protein C1646_712193 [Rhizophagus diaphanus]|nr:hypothetical protein C1646_712193 [Rhizophagus diaphanus] [Rhizophagus sp. MUCL 43196]
MITNDVINARICILMVYCCTAVSINLSRFHHPIVSKYRCQKVQNACYIVFWCVYSYIVLLLVSVFENSLYNDRSKSLVRSNSACMLHVAIVRSSCNNNRLLIAKTEG